jgi:hypothetical protein
VDIFYVATTITLVNGSNTHFGMRGNGRNPIEIASKIYETSKRKKWSVYQDLHEEAWIGRINLDKSFTKDHLSQFVVLCILISNMHLDDNADDDISRKLMKNGQYSTAWVYKLQLLGTISSYMHKIIWKACTPPKVKSQAWLAL